MAISENTKEFLEGLINYYANEASSYRQFAEQYVSEVESVTDTAFGIIAGCVYSGFLQAYVNQKKTVGLDDIQDFNKILKSNAAMIKKAIIENRASANTQDEKEPPKKY